MSASVCRTIALLMLSISLGYGMGCAPGPVLSQETWVDLRHSAYAIKSEAPEMSEALMRAWPAIRDSGLPALAAEQLKNCSRRVVYASVLISVGRDLPPIPRSLDATDVYVSLAYLGLEDRKLKLVANICPRFAPEEEYRLWGGSSGMYYLESPRIEEGGPLGRRVEELMGRIFTEGTELETRREMGDGAWIYVLQTSGERGIRSSVSLNSNAPLLLKTEKPTPIDSRLRAVSDLFALVWKYALRAPWGEDEIGARTPVDVPPMSPSARPGASGESGLGARPENDPAAARMCGCRSSVPGLAPHHF